MTKQSSEIPVLIVGGGPIGLALAADLGRRGVETLLVDIPGWLSQLHRLRRRRWSSNKGSRNRTVFFDVAYWHIADIL
jgi:2-polyprenyl-6-methoxyphenol hydroxylase-like FAD-dependent oxidoreductase